MAKIFGGKVEVPPQCSLKWYEALWTFNILNSLTRNIVLHEWGTAGYEVDLVPQMVTVFEIEKDPDFIALRQAIVAQDEKLAKDITSKLIGATVSKQIEGIIDCECNRK